MLNRGGSEPDRSAGRYTFSWIRKRKNIRRRIIVASSFLADLRMTWINQFCVKPQIYSLFFFSPLSFFSFYLNFLFFIIIMRMKRYIIKKDDFRLNLWFFDKSFLWYYVWKIHKRNCHLSTFKKFTNIRGIQVKSNVYFPSDLSVTIYKYFKKGAKQRSSQRVVGAFQRAIRRSDVQPISRDERRELIQCQLFFPRINCRRTISKVYKWWYLTFHLVGERI